MLTQTEQDLVRRWVKLRTKFDESEHPRDDHGRWTDSGGGDGGGGSTAPSGGGPLVLSEQPNQEKIEVWEKQIADRQKELEKEGKAGDTEDEQLNRMQIAINSYKQEDKETIASGKSGFTAIYRLPEEEGDHRLEASAFTYIDKNNVGIIKDFGAIDPVAHAKAIENITNQFGDKVTHLEIKQWNNDKEIIDPFLKAGFTQRGEQYGGMVTLVKAMPGGIRLGAEHAQKILGASQASAKLLGYDPQMVEASNEDHEFHVGKETKSRYAAGLAFLNTGKIMVFPRQIPTPELAVSVMAHEVMHQKYQTVLNAVEAERKEMMKDPDTLRAMRPDGSLSAPLDAKYPLYSRFVKHDNQQVERAKSDGITEYSRAYWTQAAPGVSDRTVSIPAANHETLAEMARVLTDTGTLQGAPEWKSYYRDVDKTYKELKAPKK